MNDPLDTLTELLHSLPGLGPRQSRRIAHAITRKKREWVEQLITSLEAARVRTSRCRNCARVFTRQTDETVCVICRDALRDSSTIMVVEKDVDLENIERCGAYKGTYFVLGGTIRVLDKHPEQFIAISPLKDVVTKAVKNGSLREIILALSATPSGEDTAQFVHDELRPLLDSTEVKITMLGRGLSTGSELEYIDSATLKSAFDGRK